VCVILPAATVLYFLLTNQMYLVAHECVCLSVCIESTHPPTHPQRSASGMKGRKEKRKMNAAGQSRFGTSEGCK
jgi:hypothetical protein